MNKRAIPTRMMAPPHGLRTLSHLLLLTVTLVPMTARAQREASACRCVGLANTPLLETVEGTHISSTFGPRLNPIFGTPELHEAVDIAAPMGEPIHAAADGRVTIAWLCGTYGNYVRILHAGDMATGYAHLSRFAKGIYSGAHVKAGQVIAYVGSTGLSTGPHLHFEVFVKGRPVRPVCACGR